MLHNGKIATTSVHGLHYTIHATQSVYTAALYTVAKHLLSTHTTYTSVFTLKQGVLLPHR
jgi:hypothetical protein